MMTTRGLKSGQQQQQKQTPEALIAVKEEMMLEALQRELKKNVEIKCLDDFTTVMKSLEALNKDEQQSNNTVVVVVYGSMSSIACRNSMTSLRSAYSKFAEQQSQQSFGNNVGEGGQPLRCCLKLFILEHEVLLSTYLSSSSSASGAQSPAPDASPETATSRVTSTLSSLMLCNGEEVCVGTTGVMAWLSGRPLGKNGGPCVASGFFNHKRSETLLNSLSHTSRSTISL